MSRGVANCAVVEPEMSGGAVCDPENELGGMW